MVKLVSFDSSKLSTKFVDDEFIGFVPVTVIEDHRVA